MSYIPSGNQPPQRPGIDPEDVLRLFETLGTEMQGIPAKYRDAVFAKLDRRTVASGGPGSVTGLIVAVFKAGWMDYP